MFRKRFWHGLPMQAVSRYRLFLTRRFLPIFTAQFLGAFNDNLIRSGLVVMIAYAGGRGIPLPFGFRPEVLVTLCAGLLVLPFIVFAYLAGQIADKCEKARLVTWIKLAEIAIMSVAAVGFGTHNIGLLMALLFISGTHSTIFGPIKYSILPEHLRSDELLAGSGFVAGGTYLGILFGLIAGGLLVELPHDAIGIAALAAAFIGLGMSLLIPRLKPAAPDMRIDLHVFRGTADMLAQARRPPALWHAILSISWFFTIGSLFMSQFPNYAGLVLHADNAVYTLFLAVFSIGIVLGALACDRIFKSEITARRSALALLGVSLFTALAVAATPAPAHGPLLTFSEFLGRARDWPLLAALLMVAVSGGIYVVPLYALLQEKSAAEARSRVIAASNLSDSLFMVALAVLAALLLSAGLSIPHLFLLMAAMNLGAATVVRKAFA